MAKQASISNTFGMILFASTMFASSACMFLIEPLTAKLYLPLLGGSVYVWNTCTLFFQCILLLAYLFAHFIQRFNLRINPLIILVWLPLLTLPLKPVLFDFENHPYAGLFFALSLTVGPLFFVLSLTAPLLQKFYVSTGFPQAKDPYFLYAASNLGALCGLFAYPFYVEPSFTTSEIAIVLVWIYVLFAILTTFCSVIYMKSAKNQPVEDKESSAKTSIKTATIFEWIVFTALPSSIMLGLTTYVTSELSSLPLFWIVPLAVYILSFVIAFSRFPKKLLGLLSVATPICLLILFFQLFQSYQVDPNETVLSGLITSGISFHLVCLFLVCLTCHAKVACSRPDTSNLTAFYLIIGFGGLLGSAFNTLAAPLLLSDYGEYPLAMAICAFCLLVDSAFKKSPQLRILAPYIVAFAFLISLSIWNSTQDKRTVLSARNFYGTIKVKVDKVTRTCQLWDGVTLHGGECIDPEKRGEPIIYYSHESPIGKLLAHLQSNVENSPFAILGMGTGTLASYAREGQNAQLYEINPKVIEVAKDPFYFTYLEQASKRKVKLEIIPGDARLKIKKAPDNYFGFILIDVYSSDSIPLHLVNKDAINLYLSKLKKDGCIIIHVTNTYYDIKPQLARIASSLNLEAVSCNDFSEGRIQHKEHSDWVVLSNNKSLLDTLTQQMGWQKIPVDPKLRIWTDDYCDPLKALKIPFS